MQDLYIAVVIKYRRIRNYLLVMLCKYLLHMQSITGDRVVYAEYLGADITPIIQCYYFIDRTLSLMTLNMWLSKFFTSVENITMVWIGDNKLYKSVLDFSNGIEKITGEDVSDLALDNIPRGKMIVDTVIDNVEKTY